MVNNILENLIFYQIYSSGIIWFT